MFAYVVAADALHTFVITENGWAPAGASAWKSDEPDWDALDQAAHAAQGDDEEQDEEEEDEEEEEDDSPAGEAFRKAFEQGQAGDIAGAQKTLLTFIDGGGEQRPELLANLLFTFSTHVSDEKRLDKLLDDTLALVMSDDEYLLSELVENMCMVLNNRKRGADSVRMVEHAIGQYVPLDVGCYTGMTYGALINKDQELMKQTLARIEELMSEEPELLEEQPGVFDNIAAMYLVLGNKTKTLEYVALCKEHGYEHFAAMPTMDDYAAIKDDPAFKKLFA